MVQLVNFHSNLRCTICTVSFVFTLDTLITHNFLVVLVLGDINISVLIALQALQYCNVSRVTVV